MVTSEVVTFHPAGMHQLQDMPYEGPWEHPTAHPAIGFFGKPGSQGDATSRCGYLEQFRGAVDGNHLRLLHTAGLTRRMSQTDQGSSVYHFSLDFCTTPWASWRPRTGVQSFWHRTGQFWTRLQIDTAAFITSGQQQREEEQARHLLPGPRREPDLKH